MDVPQFYFEAKPDRAYTKVESWPDRAVTLEPLVPLELATSGRIYITASFLPKSGGNDPQKLCASGED
jgi:hypothetical protein